MRVATQSQIMDASCLHLAKLKLSETVARMLSNDLQCCGLHHCGSRPSMHDCMSVCLCIRASVRVFRQRVRQAVAHEKATHSFLEMTGTKDFRHIMCGTSSDASSAWQRATHPFVIASATRVCESPHRLRVIAKYRQHLKSLESISSAKFAFCPRFSHLPSPC